MGRPKYSYRTVSTEAYKSFTLAYPEIKLTYKEWSEILYEYMSQFREYLLETGDLGKLPWGFGYFGVNKKKRKRYKVHIVNGKPAVNLAVDWKASKAEGKKIYNFNFHTDGFTYWWKWYKGTSYLALNTCIYFKASRETSRLLAKYLLKPDSEYFQIYREEKKHTIIKIPNE
jgi:Holliday junction resolvase